MSKKFLAEITDLRKQLDSAYESAVAINADRMRMLSEIDTLKKSNIKYMEALKNIAKQRTCVEVALDETIPIGSDGTRLGDIELGFDIIINMARNALKQYE